MESSSYVVSFVMQGLRHGAHTVRDFCKTRHPAVIGPQEVKSAPGPKLNKVLNINGHKLIQNNEDTAMLVRNNIKVKYQGRIIGFDLPHNLVRISTLKGQLNILNIYARSRMLHRDHLEYIELLGINSIVLGDFNAKHPSLLPHNQIKKFNKNGHVLHSYLEGRDRNLPDIVNDY